MKKLVFNKEAREELFKGMSAVHDAVASTLGPGGKNVLIEVRGSRPHITKDGATVARHIDLKDPTQNQGAQLLKSISTRTASEVGDGTTTATIIGNYLMRNGLALVERGSSAVAIERGMLRAADKAKNIVKSIAQKIDAAQVSQVAKMSVNGNEEMASLVAQAFETGDAETSVIIDDNYIPKDEIEIINGWQWTRGYLSQHFVNQASKMRAVLENPIIFITDQELTTPGVVLPLLHLARGVNLDNMQQAVRPVQPILIIAKDVTGGALATLVENHVRGLVPVCVVRGPGYAKTMNDLMSDIAAYTGTKVHVMEDLNNIGKLKYENLGKTEKAVIESNKTSLLGGSQKNLEERLAKVRFLEEQAVTDYERKDLRDRISQLKGRIASIKVGAASEIEVVERKDRYEDAVYAVKAALKSGVVVGAGTIPHILSKSRTRNIFSNLSDDQKGENLFWEALGEPIKRLYENADRLSDVKALPDYNPSILVRGSLGLKSLRGFDLHKDEKKLVNLYATGIIEPADVIITAIEQAVSLAGTVLKTTAVVTWDD